MECRHNSLNVHEQVDHSLKIIRHPLYHPKASPWFDLRVFYVRISNFCVDESTPGHLTLNHIPLSPDTMLEVNGGRSSIHSECVSSLLRRDRVDKRTEEATFVSTDSIRMTGSVRLEVYDKDDLLLAGVLELSNSNGFIKEPKNHGKKWSINCQPMMSPGSGFLKGKQYMHSETLLPTVEVYVAGCFAGTPIILTRTLQLGFQKKQHQKVMMDSIPELESTELKKDVSPEGSQISEYRGYKPEHHVDDEYGSLYSQREFIDDEDGELSWFNAGVRVGVGIGLGLCLGVGIGVGLLVHTYQATARNLKRRLI